MTPLFIALILSSPKLSDIPKPGTCRYEVLADGALGPDLGCTPGETDTDNVKVLCSTRTATRRWKPSKKEHQAFAKAYDVPKCGEVDHKIPICLGGAETVKNLWCQPAPQFKLKDVLEAKLCREVCAGTLTLGEARITILDPHNWK